MFADLVLINKRIKVEKALRMQYLHELRAHENERDSMFFVYFLVMQFYLRNFWELRKIGS